MQVAVLDTGLIDFRLLDFQWLWSVYGLAHVHYIFQSQVAVWDTRSFDRPVFTLPESKPISKIGWCLTRLVL